MIIGIGIDAVEVTRFADWHTKPLHSLKRIFSDAEIAYCLERPTHSAQRFAARFAAREAIYKTIHTIPELRNLPFLTLAHAVSVIKNEYGAPSILIDWQTLQITTPPIIWHLSLTHTTQLAIASVIAEQTR